MDAEIKTAGEFATSATSGEASRLASEKLAQLNELKAVLKL